MKTNSRLTPPVVITFAMCLLNVVHSSTGEESKTESRTAAQEDLGCDFVAGKSNKIAQVYAVTPTHVQVIYEGGKGGRKIPRQELHPALQAKYPCDATAAGEYRKRQAELAAQQVAAQSAALRVATQRKEQDVKVEIEKLTKQDEQLQGRINLYKNMPKGNGRKIKLEDLQNQRQQLRERKLNLQEQVDTLKSYRNSLP